MEITPLFVDLPLPEPAAPAPESSPELADLFSTILTPLVLTAAVVDMRPQLPSEQEVVALDAPLLEVANPAATTADPAAPVSQDAPVALPPGLDRAQNAGLRAEDRPAHGLLRATRPSAHDRHVPTLPETAAPAALAATTKHVTTPPTLPPLPPLPALEPAPTKVEAPIPMPVLPHEVPTVSQVEAPGPVVVPAEPLPVHEQVAIKVRHLAEGPDGTRELRFELHPQELGHVQVEVRVRHGRVDVALRAEQHHAVEALTDALPDLHDALDGSGLDVGRLDLDAWKPPTPSAHQDALPERRPAPEQHEPRRHTPDQPAPDDTFDALL